MDSMSFNYLMDEPKPIFTTASDTKSTNTTDTFSPATLQGSFSSLTSPFQGHGGALNLLTQQEPRPADSVPSGGEMDDVMTNFRMNGSELLFDDIEHNTQNFYMGANQPESAAVNNTNLWTDGSDVSGDRNGEMLETFDFLVKSLSSANSYVSMLTREQLSVLRSIRPALLYQFLQEVVKVRSDKRMRRALPNECAFCKNNGENEECYGSHSLKDLRGRVLCPVLRAFRCPRCGATGDRAHTIKYCPENIDGTGSLSSRRRMPPSASFLLNVPTQGAQNGLQSGVVAPIGARTPTQPCPSTPIAPTLSPSPTTGSLPHSSLWTTFGMN